MKGGGGIVNYIYSEPSRVSWLPEGSQRVLVIYTLVGFTYSTTSNYLSRVHLTSQTYYNDSHG